MEGRRANGRKMEQRIRIKEAEKERLQEESRTMQQSPVRAHVVYSNNQKISASRTRLVGSPRHVSTETVFKKCPIWHINNRVQCTQEVSEWTADVTACFKHFHFQLLQRKDREEGMSKSGDMTNREQWNGIW
jgi:hypothetical protein